MADPATQMSDPVLLALLSAAVGAMGALTVSVISERLKTHAERKTVAAVFHAELKARKEQNDREKSVDKWTLIAAALGTGQDVDLGGWEVPEPHYGVIFPANATKLGLVGKHNAALLVEYFEYLYGVRFALKNVTSGTFAGPGGIQRKAATVETGLKHWLRCEELYVELSPSLAAITREGWWQAFLPF